MKRNFGSLNLTALDMNRPSSASADCSLEDRFSAMGAASVDDCSSLDANSESTSDDNVGFPLEHFHIPATDRHSSRQSLCRESSQDVDMEETFWSEPIESVVMQARSEDGSGCLRQMLCPTSPKMPPQLPHEQHNVELNALRRLSLKVMLSNLSTSNNSSSTSTGTSTSSGNTNVAPAKPTCAYPGVNGRTKTALLPIRHPSLQSV